MILPGSNHPDSTPLKKEDPDNWFTQTPPPNYDLGDRLIYWPTEDNKGGISIVLGLAFLPYKKGQVWFYYLAPEDKITGKWIKEAEVERDWVKEKDV